MASVISQTPPGTFWDDLEKGEKLLMDAHTAASLGKVELLEKTPSTEVLKKNRYGWTPAMYAASLGMESALNFLVEAGVNLNTQNNRGQTALMLACATGNYEIITSLLSNSSLDLNIVDNTGLSALMYCSVYGHDDCIRLLCEKKVNLNLKEHKRGCTAMMIAARNGLVQVVSALLEFNTDISIKSKDGCTALDMASFSGFHNVVSVLHQHQEKASSSKGRAGSTDELTSFLEQLNLNHYESEFKSNKVNLGELKKMSEDDMKKLPFLKVGARKKIFMALHPE